jgi:4,5-dihydroxyphthalate decarboxylase
LAETVALPYLLPWLADHAAETERLMGADWWPYGLAANEHTLATFLRYSHEQHLAAEPLKPSELFAPESTESFAI